MGTKDVLRTVIAALMCMASTVASALPNFVNPVSDGSVYACSGCIFSDADYVIVGGEIQGVVKFSSTSIAMVPKSFSHVFLTLNLFGTPAFAPNVSVYGYGTEIGNLAVSDANAGAFLGTLVLPDPYYPHDVLFDVTAFVANTTASFLAFNLRASGVGHDVFSSLEFNHGHPAQLMFAPEPASVALLGLGFVGLAFSRRRHE